jgi:endonuclease/exonuclease/phosphatase family metal-dependent hydrolase
MPIIKILQWTGFTFVIVISTLIFIVWFLTYHPPSRLSITPQNSKHAPMLSKGSIIKVMSWNIQYMAGKNYVFFYDLLDGSGPDTRPSSKDITITFNEVTRIIKDESPDIILIQEIDGGSLRTGNEDQMTRLKSMLPHEYCCSASAFYWKSTFVPHGKIMGKVGMKLGIISKYKIGKSIRHALPLMPGSWIVQQFNIKRAILESSFPFKNGGSLSVLNTHLDAFAQGENTMEKQVGLIDSLLKKKIKTKIPWLIAGDFNLLPPGKQFSNLAPPQQKYFRPDSELEKLTSSYTVIPSLKDANGPEFTKWLTHLPNDPSVKKPDRTIDFFFISPLLVLKEKKVRQNDTHKISDHFPVIIKIKLP